MSQIIYTPTFDSAGTPHGNYWQMYLSDLPDYTALSNLFDAVRIDKVHWCLTPALNGVSYGLGNYFVCIDYDDASTPGSETALINHENTISVPGTCGIKREFVPAIASPTYGAGYTVGQRIWCNLDFSGTALYGVKVWFSSSGGAFNYNLTVQVDLTLKCVR